MKYKHVYIAILSNGSGKIYNTNLKRIQKRVKEIKPKGVTFIWRKELDTGLYYISDAIKID